MPLTQTDWPAINSLSWLRLPCCGDEHPTRIEDLSSEHVLVGAPVAPHPEPVRPPRNDDGFFIGWVVPDGAMEAPVKLVALKDSPVPMWELQAIGPAIQTQRRKFVRVELALEVNLLLMENGTPTVATTLDLSEGGLRCKVDRLTLDPKGKLFPVEFTAGDRDYELQGQVAWWGNLDLREQRTVGVKFMETEQKVADDLRAFVFRTQIEQRRNAR